MGDQGHLHITPSVLPTSAQNRLRIILGPPHLSGSHYLGLHLPVQCGHWPWFLSQYTERLRQLPQAVQPVDGMGSELMYTAGSPGDT